MLLSLSWIIGRILHQPVHWGNVETKPVSSFESRAIYVYVSREANMLRRGLQWVHLEESNLQACEQVAENCDCKNILRRQSQQSLRNRVLQRGWWLDTYFLARIRFKYRWLWVWASKIPWWLCQWMITITNKTAQHWTRFNWSIFSKRDYHMHQLDHTSITYLNALPSWGTSFQQCREDQTMCAAVQQAFTMKWLLVHKLLDVWWIWYYFLMTLMIH